MNASSEQPAALAEISAEDLRESVARLRESNSRLEFLAEATARLHAAQNLRELMSVAGTAARNLAQADGVSIILREEGHCYYAEESAIEPLWRGRRFPLSECISGWAMLNRQTAVVPDVASDERIRSELYRSTFVKSLVMVPVGVGEPSAAIGAYWARPHAPDVYEVAALETLARATGTALRSLGLLDSLRQSEERFRTLFESIDEGFCVVEILFDERMKPVDYRFLETNPAFDRHTGLREARGRRARELVPGLEEHWFETYGRVALTREPVRFESHSMRMNRWYDVYAFPIGQARDWQVAILFNDITQRKLSEERQALLMREIDHRAKNMLATIQAMVSLSARSQTDIDEYIAAIQERLQSLAHAHNLVAESRWKGASLRALIEKELAPYVQGRAAAADIDGEALVLRPPAAMALTLIVHELATNAAKYGSLSTPSGRVHVRWLRRRGGALWLQWRECGGPPARPPRRRGFGSLLIEKSLEGELGGNARLRFGPAGVTCTIELPASQIVQEARAQARSRGQPERSATEGAARQEGDRSPRILLVEDQAMIALSLAATIESFGYEVVGPAKTLGEARRFATDATLEGAVLDVNLGDTDVFPVADLLEARGIPFLFASGYDLRTLPGRFQTRTLLAKPIDAQLMREALSRLLASGKSGATA